MLLRFFLLGDNILTCTCIVILVKQLIAFQQSVSKLVSAQFQQRSIAVSLQLSAVLRYRGGRSASGAGSIDVSRSCRGEEEQQEEVQEEGAKLLRQVVQGVSGRMSTPMSFLVMFSPFCGRQSPFTIYWYYFSIVKLIRNKLHRWKIKSPRGFNPSGQKFFLLFRFTSFNNDARIKMESQE